VGKAVKKNLFFWVFGFNYGRFWSRLFTYIKAPLEKENARF
jgi:hypothetical protein